MSNIPATGSVTIYATEDKVVIRPNGAPGADGEGVPVGGTTGQVLAKASNTDYDTEWVNNDPDGVQSVTGDGVGGTATDVVMTFPTAGEIGAIPSAEKGAANGVATLGANSIVPYAQTFVTPWPSSGDASRFYATRFIRGVQTVGLNLSTWSWSNIVEVPVDMSIESILCNVISNGGAGCLVELALYTYNADYTQTCTLIASAGTVDASSNGVKEAIFGTPINVSAGVIRIVCAWNGVGTQPSLRFLNGSFSLGVTSSSGAIDGISSHALNTVSAYPLPATIAGFGYTTVAPSLVYKGTPL